ncbi:MAG TPA: hypothetical protein VF461_16695 [Gemmatimonadaceae bacterium]
MTVADTSTVPTSSGLTPFAPPGTSDARAGSRATDVASWLFWACGLALVLPVWMGAQFPSEDGLAHLAWTEVYRALGATDSVWRQFYERGAQWNTPNLSYFGLQYALGAVVSPYVAQQLIVSALIVLWVASTYALSVALTGRISIGAFVSLLLVHSSWLYGGYFSFLFGVPPLLLSLALVIRIVDPSTLVGRRDFFALAVLGVLAYYSHVVAAAMFLMLLFITAAFLRRSPRRAVGVGIAAAPVALLFASYLLADSLGAGGMRWEPVGKTIARFVGLAFFRGFAAPSSAFFWLALATFAAIVFVLCLDTVRRYRRRDPEPDPDHDRLSVAAPLIFTLVACLAVLYVVSPDGIGDGYNLKARFQLVMWAWLLPALVYRGRLPSPPVLVTATAALLAWQVATFAERTYRFNAAYEVARVRAPALPPGSTLEGTLDYDHAAFDGSFIKVLALAPEDFAYRCGCVLLDGYHPSTAFYWVRTLAHAKTRPAYRLQIRQMPGGPVTVTVEDGSAR